MRCSITSRSSPAGSASAPSADISAHFPHSGQKTLATLVSPVTPSRCAHRCGQHRAYCPTTSDRPAQLDGIHIPARLSHQPCTPNAHAGTMPEQAVRVVMHRLHSPYYYCGYLSLFSSQKNTVGEHRVHSPPLPLERGSCHPHRLAFKLRLEALRLVSDCRLRRSLQDAVTGACGRSARGQGFVA